VDLARVPVVRSSLEGGGRPRPVTRPSTPIWEVFDVLRRVQRGETKSGIERATG
jgi:hypothetical protein